MENPLMENPQGETPCLYPKAGPQYWSWRCLRCGCAMDDHMSWWKRVRAEWTRSKRGLKR